MTQYKNTNETLQAIVTGLDIQPTDRVLSICGSGDQALAMLQYAQSVLAVDNSQGSLFYARKRIDVLKRGKYKQFLLHELDTRSIIWNLLADPEDRIINYDKDAKDAYAYFSVEGRLQQIREKLGSLIIDDQDIFSLRTDSAPFDKVYLSNAMHYPKCGIEDSQTMDEKSDSIFNVVKPDGLVYIAQRHFDATARIERAMMNNFSLDRELTTRAEALECKKGWHPQVYRRPA